jgi:hypothetical protein
MDMNWRLDHVFKAMRPIVCQRNGGMGCENAKAIKQRQRQRCPDPKAFAKACQHRISKI